MISPRSPYLYFDSIDSAIIPERETILQSVSGRLPCQAAERSCAHRLFALSSSHTIYKIATTDVTVAGTMV